MLNFGLIKITCYYVVCIFLCYYFNLDLDNIVWQLGIGIVILLNCLKKYSIYSIYVLLATITIFQFQSLFPSKDTFSASYCNINTIRKGAYNTQLYCTCKNQGLTFNSILFYSGKQDIKKGEQYFVNAIFLKINNVNLKHEFSYAEYLKKKQILFEVRALRDYQLKKIRDADVLSRSHDSLMMTINNRLQIYFNDHHISIIKALCFGDKRMVNPQTLEYFRKAGLMHIIAVSGLHVGIIQYLLLLILRIIFGKKSKSQITQQAIVLFVLIIFAWICEFSMSIVRSVFMFSILYYGMLSRKVMLSIHGLFLSAFILLLFNPLQVLDLGFQFSYLATFGLLYGSKYVQKLSYLISSALLRWITEGTLISLIAQCFLSPLLFYYFGEIPILFLLFNIPGFIFVALIIVLVFLFFVLGTLHPALANVIVYIIEYSIAVFERMLLLTDLIGNSYFAFKLNSFIEAFFYCITLWFLYNIVFRLQWKSIRYFIISLISLFLVRWVYDYETVSTSEIIVWNTTTEKAITVKHLDTIYYYSSYILPLDKRINEYVRSRKSKLKHEILETSDVEDYSYLYKLRALETDTILCVLFHENKEVSQYFNLNYPNKIVTYLSFKKLKDKAIDTKRDVIELRKGTTLLSNNKSVYFYP